MLPKTPDNKRKPWRVDLTLESWRDRAVTILCGMGILIPLGRAYNEGTIFRPWEWTGDRIAVIIIFIMLGVLTLDLSPED